MAATMAIATGEDKSGRLKRTTRLGARAAMGEANTWRTFARVITFADGSGTFTVSRDGETVHSFAWWSEKASDEHAAAFGDEHDENCPLCGVDAQS